MNNYLYILVAALVTYTLRVVPLTLFRRPIKNRFIKSFLHYLPAVTLSVMSFPAILTDVGSVWLGGAAFVVGLIVCWIKPNLFLAAVSTMATVLIFGIFI